MTGQGNKKNIKNKTFSRKVTQRLAFYLAGLFLLLYLLSAYLLDEWMHADLRDRANILLRYKSDSIAKPMWDFDDVQVKKIMSQIEKEDFVAFVKLRDSEGNIVYEDESGKNAGVPTSEYKEFFTKKIKYKYKDKKHILGEIEVYVDDSNVHEMLFRFLAQVFVLNLLLIVILVILINRTILKGVAPIKLLTRQLSDISVNNAKQEMVKIRTDIEEVQELYSALVKMKSHFNTYSNELEEDVSSRTAELEEYKNHLEKMVNDQTFELKEAVKASEKANAAKSEFLANMSHELRTPMHAIMSYSEMCIEKIDGDKDRLKKFLENIRVSASRLLTLINDLLDLSRLESGKAEMIHEKNDMTQLTNEVLEELGSLLKNKDIAVEQRVETEDPSCISDRAKVVQVVTNIISNAIKFSERHGHLIIRYADREVQFGEKTINALEISFEDNGCGIPQHELKLIFDKFTQSSKTKDGSGGSGLGLAICHEIIRSHKGNIWAENVSPKGSKFVFVVPRSA